MFVVLDTNHFRELAKACSSAALLDKRVGETLP